MQDESAGPDLDRLHWGTLRDWAQLVRLPNTFTLFSDCLAAAILAGSYWQPLTVLLPMIAASLCAYWAGMILNDVVDVEEDRESRPNRPLAAGRISPVIAGHVATGMLMIGPIIVLGTTTLHQTHPLWMGAAFASAVLLSLAVRSYNSPLKHSPLGPLLMGGCRLLNIWMIGSAFYATQGVETVPWTVIYFGLAIGLYIVGVTVYARREETHSSAAGLVVGLLLEAGGLGILAYLPRWERADFAFNTLAVDQGYPLLIGLIAATVIHRGWRGVMHPVPRKVQLAVKHALLTLILLDASVVLMWGGAWYGLAVVLLLLPALMSALRFRST